MIAFKISLVAIVLSVVLPWFLCSDKSSVKNATFFASLASLTALSISYSHRLYSLAMMPMSKIAAFHAEALVVSVLLAYVVSILNSILCREFKYAKGE